MTLSAVTLTTTLAVALVLTPQSAAEHHEKAVDFHLRHWLDEASTEYAKTLALDPPREPTAEQRKLAEALAPRVFATASEPFALRDFAAIIHPDAPVIAYHLFWDDDIDFPDDNEPCDHELVTHAQLAVRFCRRAVDRNLAQLACALRFRARLEQAGDVEPHVEPHRLGRCGERNR